MGNINLKGTLTPQAQEFIAQWEDDSPVVMAHTSGSTGKPKEIRLLKADMRVSARATNRFFGITGDSALHLPLSPDYIAGKMQIVRALEAGCHLTVEPPTSKPLSTESGLTIDMVPIVPAQIDGLLASPSLPRIRNVIVGGAPLSPQQEEALISAGVNAYATYGMTETCSHVALRHIGTGNYMALPGFTFSANERGCLVINTSTLSCGRLVTNDMVRLSSEKEFEWLGRYDNVINSGGVKIHPEEVEKVLGQLIPPGAKAYVTSRANQRWGQEAVIVTDSLELTAAVTERMKEMLPPHHAPRDIIYVKEIAMTSSGKIIRQRF